MSNSKQIFKEAMERKPSQKQKILNMLREAGEKGVLNTILVRETGIRFNARISEMYQEGYKIDVENIERGVCRYTLISEPTVENKNVMSAIDLLVSQINNKANGCVSSTELVELLKQNNFNVVRKSGSYK